VSRFHSEQIGGVVYTLHAVPDDVPVLHGHDSGDPEQNRRDKAEILARLDAGDVWAWADVEVRATVAVDGHTVTGSDYLGGCCYADAADFMQEGGYYRGLRIGALKALVANLEQAARRGQAAAEALRKLAEEPV